MLIGNYSVLSKHPGLDLGGGAIGLGCNRSDFNKSSQYRGAFTGETWEPKSGVPDGQRPPYTWVLPITEGGIAARKQIVGLGAFTGAGALGRNIEATADGVALLDAIGQLVVSAVATISASATVSGDILAALAAAASLTAQGDMAGAIDAFGWAISALEGAASTAFVPSATGTMAGTIEVGAAAELTAGSIAEEILDSQMVETGLTVRETLKLCAAALAGKVSISGNTVTIRNAVADDTDRIVATTTTEGERTAITYDVG